MTDKQIPAFPCHPNTVESLYEGMTLRDYFAAKAMAVVMPAVINELKKTRGSVKEAQRLQALSAETCYVLADAMLEARNGTG
jgi:TRAP-type uncharacterized transport system substrate-binding protein